MTDRNEDHRFEIALIRVPRKGAAATTLVGVSRHDEGLAKKVKAAIRRASDRVLPQLTGRRDDHRRRL